MIRRVLIYGALLIGALIFAWPFFWMASVSAKLDREMFGQNRMLPERPIPRVQSPYVDDRLYDGVTGPRMDDALPIIEQHLQSIQIAWPTDVDRAALVRHTARGIYKRLLNVLPASVWQQTGEQLTAAVRENMRPALVAEIVQELRRVFCVGQLRARSLDLQEDVLVPANSVANTWLVEAGAAHLVQGGTAEEPFGELIYDFTRGDVVRLTQTFTTSFPVDRLYRLQMSLRYDNTWHAVRMYVEKNGVRYRAVRDLESSDYNWVLNTWQERGPDDRLTKIRTWTLLDPERPGSTGPAAMSSRAERSGVEESGGETRKAAPRDVSTSLDMTPRANQLTVTLELRRVNQFEAWWSKIRRNYRLTLDHIPFWRYVGTSLFLVILNLVGTLLSCSLVAYAFARLQWPGREVCFALLLATMMLPVQVTMIPQFLIMQKLGWYNTLQPLWIASFVAPAFYVFLLRQFLKGIPRDLEDAARLDGCGFLRIYWHIMLPLVKPTLAAIAIFTFLGSWNEFMGPLIYVNDSRLYPLSFGLYAFQVQVADPGTSKGMGMLMAASLMMMLPVIAIFFFAQRYFLRGVTLTGMKG
ncbi:MAG: ABC transporter, permease protein 2 (cluster 1, maltose/g3p/polyamine/iron) [uncultured Chthoniobacterales bacterium]|uniref:ABC transporter, permease protein 2 (Cluster 1, maltose/g3p/polyamine/iron) n=1 Tax=uncultured Chthoniobacterales bacterium TaxID=1836801 RepID=A0A6J4IUW3_9BACT|nr:MAG: ABC transporter, permease protein 2 (cluster 1, maltose/g3p/polyamine/iron) [uncultured Chthoniobacterales bacterium]